MKAAGSVALVLAGGKGLRLGAEVPKQYLPLCGRPVLAWSLLAFQESRAEQVVIVAAEEYLDLCRRIAQEAGCKKAALAVAGGRERYDSVACGLAAVKDRIGEDTIILIHDGARPLIRPDTINRLMEEAGKYGAAIAAAPCTDTLKLVDTEGNVVSTTDRRFTWAAQTPQVFRGTGICRAYELAVSEGGPALFSVTDDAMVYQRCFPGFPVRVVNPGHPNFKITAASDLPMAELFLKEYSSRMGF